ncbi:MAG: hypothetical protein ACLQJ7_16005 [Syntrophobacteraceae bacterium]
MLAQLGISVSGSLIAAAIAFLIAVLCSRIVRRALTAMASTFLGIQVKYVFRNGKEAEAAIKQELAESSFVRVFAGRGLQFQESLYSSLLEKELSSHREVRVLLPNPDVASETIDWISHRETELSKVDRSFGQEMLREQIRVSIRFLLSHLHEDNFQLRLYNTPHIGRIILTDQSVFFSPYSSTKHGRDCKVFEYGRGDIYDNFVRFFDMVWQNSVQPQQQSDTQQTGP